MHQKFVISTNDSHCGSAGRMWYNAPGKRISRAELQGEDERIIVVAYMCTAALYMLEDCD